MVANIIKIVKPTRRKEVIAIQDSEKEPLRVPIWKVCYRKEKKDSYYQREVRTMVEQVLEGMAKLYE